MTEPIQLVIIAICTFAGSILGSMIGTRLIIRDYVTRDEAIEMAREIDHQRREIEGLWAQIKRLR